MASKNTIITAAVALSVGLVIGSVSSAPVNASSSTLSKTVRTLVGHSLSVCINGTSGVIRASTTASPCTSGETTFLLGGGIGAAGPQGPQGDAGPQGLPGAKGDAGVQGDTGPQGDIGPQGLRGLTGSRGITGDTGPQGLPGNDGAQGAVGPVGPQGPVGPRGPDAFAPVQP